MSATNKSTFGSLAKRPSASVPEREVSVSQPSSSNIDAISSRVRGSSSATKARRGIETLRRKTFFATQSKIPDSVPADITYKRCSFLRAETVQSVCAMGHVWTAPSWQGQSSRRRLWSVQPCVRPLNAVHMTAGHNALRGSGPGQKHAFEDAVAHVGCPDRRIDRLCITCCSPSQP